MHLILFAMVLVDVMPKHPTWFCIRKLEHPSHFLDPKLSLAGRCGASKQRRIIRDKPIIYCPVNWQGKDYTPIHPYGCQTIYKKWKRKLLQKGQIIIKRNAKLHKMKIILEKTYRVLLHISQDRSEDLGILEMVFVIWGCWEEVCPTPQQWKIHKTIGKILHIFTV